MISLDTVCDGAHCITCSDEGVPMTVTRFEDGTGLTLCTDALGSVHEVETTLLEGVAPGTVVLVHADVAIAALAPEELL
jgi:hydrogenase expression/formation protein HypC